MNKNTKAKLRLVIILIALVIVTIIGVMEYHNVTNIKKIAQNKDIELKDQTVWNSETQGLGLEVTEADITTKSITVKVVKAEIESASEQDLEYKYYIKESNKVDYAKTASYTGAEKSYTFSNLVAGKNYDVKVVLTNTNTKTEIESEIKVINTKQMPNAQEEITKGTITASEPTWSNEKASVTLSTTTGLEIEYQINTATEGGWTQGTTVSNLKNGDIVRIRLSDGKNKGNAGSITIGEEAQEVSITTQETTANSITVKVASNNKEYREETRPEYSYYIKEASTTNYPSTPTYTGTDSYTFNSLTSGKKYDIKVVLTNKAGNVIQGELKENETISDPTNIYVTLYTDGTLAFSNNTEKMAGKTVQKEYGNIKDQIFTEDDQGVSTSPWEPEAESVLRGTIVNKIMPKSTAFWFYKCSNMTEVTNMNNLDTSNTIDMNQMFCRCEKLASIDVSGFDTSKVTDMQGMFSSCESLTTIDVSGFNTSNVTDMNHMFYICRAITNIDLRNFDTSKVTRMDYMFTSCEKLTSLDVGRFDTSNVTNMHDMFNGCNGLTSLNVSNFNTSNVTEMYWMFAGCSSLTSLDVSNFNTSNVTSMSSMFRYCELLTSIDASNFDTSNVTNMAGMFDGCRSLTNLNLSNFDTSNVTRVDSMFSNCSNLTNLDLSSFNTSQVTNMGWMFENCSNLKTVYASTNFVTTKVTSSDQMFNGCTSLVGGNGTKYNSSYINKTYARIDKTGTPGYFTAKLDDEIINAPFIDSQTDKSDYYGKIVTNYDCTNNAGVNAWKIFYADSNNIYLITDDYIPYDYMPYSTTEAGTSTSNKPEQTNENTPKDYPRAVYFTDIVDDYSTGSARVTNSTIKNLNKKYFDYLTANNANSTNSNMQATAYMLDTNAWSGFKGEKADYAIGGAPIEMLFASYNQTHSTNYQTRVQSATGYQISKDGGTNWANEYSGMISTNDATYGTLYLIPDDTNAPGCYLASPRAGYEWAVPMVIMDNGLICSDGMLINPHGCRPLVCLKSDVELERLADGNFKIKDSITTGEITANSMNWGNGTATVTLGTTSSLTIQYKKGSSGTWTTGTTVTGLKHNDVVYVRLTDGSNYSAETTINILDGTNSTASISLSTTNTKLGETITATVTHTDAQSGVNTTSCKYVYNATSSKLGTTSTAWNTATAFSSSTQTINLTASTAGTYYLHVLTVDKAENKTETISQSVMVEGTTLESLMETAATKNETVYDKYGNKITVPKGFKIVTLAEDSTVVYEYDKESGVSTNTPVVQDGIVIKDSAGNQFVWIPIGEIKNDAVENTTNKTTITLGRYTFDTTGQEELVQAAYTEENTTNYTNKVTISPSCQEDSTPRDGIASEGLDGKNATAKDLASFVESVKIKGGYYIARYEASYGSGYNSSGTTDALKYANAKPLSKPSTANSEDSMNYTPGTLWNYISELNAAKVARNMYAENKDINNNEVGVESDLINSYAWDTAIVFIQKYSSNTAYSNQNSKNSSLANTGERQGTTDKVCNIYDMASNTREWTTEYFTLSNGSNAYPCVLRGGDYNLNRYDTASRDYYMATYSSSNFSFRLTLYIK